MPQCQAYLRDNLYFYLGPRERRGLALFYERAVEMGLARPEWTLDSTFARLLDKAVAGDGYRRPRGLRSSRATIWRRQGRRRGFDYAPAASRGLSHVQHRPKHQLHERLYGGL